MQLRAASGDVGGALAVYKRLWDVLDEEYDVEPSKETQELVAVLKLAQPATPALPPAVAVPAVTKPRLIVAVGQFDVSAIEPERSYFLQGFRRELIANLVRFREWSVRDGTPRTASVGAASSADHEYVLEGAALQGPDGYRLVVTLLNTRDNEYVWSGEHRLTLEGWVESQQSLVRRIASAMNVYLSAGRLAQVASHSFSQLKAYDRWLYGQSKLLTWEAPAFAEAMKIFREIIAETPDFSSAYSALAQLHNVKHFIHPGVYRDEERTQQALSFAREATRLDPVDSRGHLSLGWAHAMANQYELSEAHHQIAQELNGNDGWTATSVALSLALRGELEEAKAEAKRALDITLNPAPHHWAYHLQILFMNRDYAASVAAGDKAGEVIPTSRAWRIAALAQSGRRKEAVEAAKTYVDSIRSRWFGSEPPTDENIARWTLHGFPIRRKTDWQHFSEGLGLAGLPVAGVVHDVW
jgi:tetratricopeptide (TPR) repeat protein